MDVWIPQEDQKGAITAEKDGARERERQPPCLVYFDLFTSPLLYWFINQLEYLLNTLSQTVNMADCFRAQAGTRPTSVLPQSQSDL